MKFVSCVIVFILFDSVLGSFEALSTKDPIADLGFTPITRIGIPAPQTARWSDAITGAYPTNSFWTNLVLGPGDDRSNNLAGLPYVLQTTHDALTVMYPYAFASNEKQYLNDLDDIQENLKFSSKQFIEGGNGGYQIQSFDPFSVTVRWNGNENGSYMESPLVRGNPYVTMKYSKMTPAIYYKQSLIPGSFMVDGKPANCAAGEVSTGTKFQFSFIQSDRTWRLYSSQAINYSCSSDAASFRFEGTDLHWNGVWRISMINNCTTGFNAQHCPARSVYYNFSNYAELIDQHANTIVVGADVSFSERNATQSLSEGVNVIIKWKTEVLNDQEQVVEPLMFGLPFHSQILDRSLAKILNLNATHRTVRGVQVPIVGSTWSLQYSLPDIGFEAPSPIDADKKDLLVKTLKEDYTFDPPLNYQTGVGDPYYAGKMLARMARVVLIAEQLGETEIASNVTARLKTYLEPWLNHQSKNQLIYDKSWRGIISCGCQYDDCSGKCAPHCVNNNGDSSEMTCPASTDAGFDFGNGFYNDHHFHYGYHIYASAVIAKIDSTWAKEHHELILALIRDIANPSKEDFYFPQFRFMDMYESHSWALGIPLAGNQPFYNGKDQESTSEAVNAWYAISLYGKAIADENIELLGKSLLAMEIKGAQTFWQVKNDSEIYPQEYVQQHVFGIIWSHLAQYQTFFSNTGWAIHGIQQLPYTPISEVLLDPTWVEEAFTFFQNSCDGQCDSDGWRTFVCLEQSIIDKEAGYACAQKLPDSAFDGKSPGGNGNSRTNTYYFIATRPSRLTQDAHELATS